MSVQTDLQFKRRKDGVYAFVSPGTMQFAMPEDSIMVTVTGTEQIRCPSETMSQDHMKGWLKELISAGSVVVAQDGLRVPLTIDVD